MSKFGWSYPAGAANDPNAPYNQDMVGDEVPDAIAERPLNCPCCLDTVEFIREYDKVSPYGGDDRLHDELVFDGWRCENCEWEQETIEQDYDRLKFFVNDLKPRIKAVHDAIHKYRNQPKNKVKLEDVIGWMPEDGDFEYSEDEAGDWHAYCCGEKDCPQQWHKSAYGYAFKKEGDIFTITCMEVDEDGNWDHNCEWTTGDEWEGSDVQYCLSSQNDDYFSGWAEYWIDCAESGKDPLDESIRGRDENWTGAGWMEFCINAAEDNIKYLKMGKKD